MKLVMKLAVLLAALVAVPSSAFADATVKAAFLESASVEDDRGSMSSASMGTSVSWEQLTLSYEATRFSWDDKRKLPFGNGSDDPWKTLHDLALSYDDMEMLSDVWGVFGGASVSSSFERGLGGSLGAGAHVGGIYAVSERLSFNLGVAAGADGLGFGVLPLAGVSWDERDEAGAGWFVEGGFPALEAGYDFSGALGVHGALGMGGGTYKLASDNTAARDGHASFSGIEASLFLMWRPLEALRIECGPVAVFNRSVTLHAEDGDEKGTYDVDDAMGGFLSLTYEF